MRIAYGTAELPVGKVDIGVSGNGICYIGLHSGRNAIPDYYPKAEVIHDQQAITPVVAVLRRWFAGEDMQPVLDVQGTAFQRRVWDAMRRIPRGKTRTYADLARVIGRPGAYRAVGGAVGANPVAMLLPCHRVVASNGGLGGYAWGLPMKKRLLEMESSSPESR